MKKYIYFISYNWQTRFTSGSGNLDITHTGNGPMDSIDDIREIEACIKKDLIDAGFCNPAVQVMNFQLLREEKCD